MNARTWRVFINIIHCSSSVLPLSILILSSLALMRWSDWSFQNSNLFTLLHNLQSVVQGVPISHKVKTNILIMAFVLCALVPAWSGTIVSLAPFTPVVFQFLECARFPMAISYFAIGHYSSSSLCWKVLHLPFTWFAPIYLSHEKQEALPQEDFHNRAPCPLVS